MISGARAPKMKLGVYSEEGANILSNIDEDTTFLEFRNVLRENMPTTQEALEYLIFYLSKKYLMKDSEYMRYRNRSNQ